MNQSKLETRPSSRLGTRRPLVVAQTIVPAPSSALNAKQAAIACHGNRARPYPAIASVETVHTT